MDQLIGKWQGKVDTQQGTLEIGFRFGRTEQGDCVGFLDSPDQIRMGMPISDARLEEGILTLKVVGLMAQYRAKLLGNRMSGQILLGTKSYNMPM